MRSNEGVSALLIAAMALLLLCLLAVGCGGSSTEDSGSPTSSPTISVNSTPTPTPEPDDEPYPEGAKGYAISWPQCGALLPDEPYDFGIVGVTNGVAFTDNPCFEQEYDWAERGKYHPAIYMNTNFAAEDASYPECEDESCAAYHYGWDSAGAAYDFADSFDAVAPVWWLDVQIVSEWSEDLDLNAQSIQGAMDFLEGRGIRVGISSTGFQWASVTGGVRHELSVWDASALDVGQAVEFCGGEKDFGGGAAELIAYVEGYETVVACGPQRQSSSALQ